MQINLYNNVLNCINYKQCSLYSLFLFLLRLSKTKSLLFFSKSKYLYWNKNYSFVDLLDLNRNTKKETKQKGNLILINEINIKKKKVE
jgi:hypothetical protein